MAKGNRKPETGNGKKGCCHAISVRCIVYLIKQYMLGAYRYAVDSLTGRRKYKLDADI